jgi:hypothetical protein
LSLIMPNAKDTDIPVAYLRECFDHDAASPSGLRWRQRPREHFATERARRIFNTKFAGKHGGTLNDMGYWHVTLTVDGRLRILMAHRVTFALVNGRWPIHGVDHEDRVPSNNKPSNLRDATQGQNNQNASLRSDNTSGVKGVWWDKDKRTWVAYITVGRHRIHLGYFDIFDHACQARIGAETVLHPFRRSKPKPLDPATIIPDGALVTGCYSFTGKPKRVTYTYLEAA